MESAFRTLWIYDKIVINNLKYTENELAEEFEVTTRTINRTIRTINRFIYPKRIRKNDKDDHLRVIQLSEEEMY